MNKGRRKQISDLIENLEALKGDLETIQADEEEYRDNMPENLQGSERYHNADSAVNALTSAVDSLDEALGYMNEAIE